MSKAPKSNTKLHLHPRNRYAKSYNFSSLAEVNPQLKSYIVEKEDGTLSINFKKPKAVIELNKALLLADYQIQDWKIPEGYLCPPIPGRLDYLHYVADLLAELGKEDQLPKGECINVLDIGTGSSLIYPLLGSREFNWNFVASDIDDTALESASNLLASNTDLESKIDIRKQNDPQRFFANILNEDDSFDLCICNPPFHNSEKQAQAASERKNQNLGIKGKESNFGGQAHELWYQGGELAFIKKMIKESKEVQYRFLYFTTLVSKKDHIKSLIHTLNKEGIKNYKVVEMAQGNKVSRMLVWSFLPKQAMRDWRNALWEYDKE